MMRLYQQLYIAQPQTNAGQRTIGKITAPIELIEYTILFGNRNTDTIIRHPYHQLVILQKTIYNNMHRLARILHGVFYQITDNIRNMHWVCRYQSLRTEMGFNMGSPRTQQWSAEGCAAQRPAVHRRLPCCRPGAQ